MMTRNFLIHVVLLYCQNIFFEIHATEDDSVVCNHSKYGVGCQYNCSSFCNFDKCSISHHKGVPECNAGCKKYHTGFFCQEFCPSLCLECNQTDGTCHKCIDGYYGMTCNQTCGRNCLNGTCNTTDGSCISVPYTAGGNNTRLKRASSEELCLEMNEDVDVCQCCTNGRRGDSCEKVCQNCQTYHVPLKVCEYQCKAGYYGHTCDKLCPEACQPGNSGKPVCKITLEGLRCMNGCNRGYTGLQCNDTCSRNCKDSCYQRDGKCVDCPNGKYGDMCNKYCSVGCKNKICSKEDGSCQGGCTSGFYGNNCTGICGVNCANSKCEDHFDGANPNRTFLCSEGCKNGYKGRSCDEVCPKNCLICKQLSGECVDVFHLENGTSQSSLNPVVIIITIAATLIFSLAVMCALKRRKRCSFLHTCNGAQRSGTENSNQVNNVEQESHMGNNETIKLDSRMENWKTKEQEPLTENRITTDQGPLMENRITTDQGPLMENRITMEQEPVIENRITTEQEPLIENGITTEQGPFKETKEKESSVQGNKRLIQACRAGNLGAVKKILGQPKTNINFRGRHGMTPIMEAIAKGHTKVAYFLLQKGCDLSAVADNNNTVLHVACYKGNIEFVKNLLDKKLFDINAKGNMERSPLLIAAKNGNKDLFDLLRSKCADVNTKDCCKDTILHIACFNKNEEFFKHLLMLNCIDINVKDCKGRTPVLLAAYNGYRGMFDLLWNHPGCDKSAKDDNNDTILHVACYNDNEEFVGHLLSLQVFDIECKGCKGRSPAMIAAQNGCRKVFELLVETGCNLKVMDEKRHNILTLACCSDNVVLVEYLLTLNTFDINIKGNKGRTPLLVAAKKGCRKVFTLLVEKGGDLLAKDDKGNSVSSLAPGDFEEILQR